MSLAHAFAPLVDLVYPPRCPLCGEGLAAQSGLCSSCWSELVIPGSPCCASCQRPFARDIPGGAMVCGPCLAEPPAHDGIAAATLYNDASRKLVLSFKYGHRISLAPMMAHQIAVRLPVLEGEWLLVPVPLHRGRLWRRGFNQAALLAREIAKRTSANLMVDGLLRHKATPTLGELGAKARKRTLSGAIAANPQRATALKGAQIILVDDVLTSGATSTACVRALKRVGARRVIVACFARVLDEALDIAG